MLSTPTGPETGPAPAPGEDPVAEIAAALVGLGCPADRSPMMAAQLDKRARQLSAERGWTGDQALAHLLRLMAGGWAAPGATGQPPPDLPAR
ncbi:MAG: hypothetical protein ACKOET_18400 [Verrucomicrobiota bacterium]